MLQKKNIENLIFKFNFLPKHFTAITDFQTNYSPAGFNEFSQDIAKDVSCKLVFGFFLILDILIIKSNSLKRFRNILQSSKKSPYQRNDEISKNFRTHFFRTTILLYKNDIFINISQNQQEHNSKA